MNQSSQQTLRQIARRKTREVVERRRQERLQKERRVVAHAETIMVAIAERDLAIEVTEARAGAALRALIETEGLSVREAVEWCGGSLDTREATRLRRWTGDSTDPDGEPPTESAAQPGDVETGAPPSAAAIERSTPAGDAEIVGDCRESMGAAAR